MWRHWLWVLALGLAGCGKHGDAGSEVARAPSHSGDVWETDKASDRKAAAATVLAFVNGLHTVVVDGGDIYAGTTRLGTTADSADKGRLVTLSNGLTAQLIPQGDAMELHFSSGESVPMRRQTRAGK
jgi:hypothetical protein